MLLLLAAVFITSCGDEAPYESYGDVVTVSYNANGGTFTTNTSVIKDSYNVSTIPTNRFGQYEIPLVDPANPVRGAENSFLAAKPGYFLVGWYARVNVAEAGAEPVYRYEKWDFENDTFAFEKKSYAADEPVIELYAMWLPEFTFEFYDLDTGKLISSRSYDPMYVESLRLPEWDKESGTIKMHDFPKVEGKTFVAAYSDPNGLVEIEGRAISNGVIDYENISAENTTTRIYVKMNEGAWYNIYTAEQFVEIKDPNGNYNILADLDFSEEGWIDDFVDGKFTGTIRGNGHAFRNIQYYQSSASMSTAGLFGTVASGAVIEDVRFENLDFIIESGSRYAASSFGTFAGIIEDGATIEEISISGKLTVTPSPYITESTIIGLFCGTGDPGDIDLSGIRCVALPPETEYDTGLLLTVDGNNVIVEVIPAEKE